MAVAFCITALSSHCLPEAESSLLHKKFCVHLVTEQHLIDCWFLCCSVGWHPFLLLLPRMPGSGLLLGTSYKCWQLHSIPSKMQAEAWRSWLERQHLPACALKHPTWWRVLQNLKACPVFCVILVGLNKRNATVFGSELSYRLMHLLLVSLCTSYRVLPGPWIPYSMK